MAITISGTTGVAGVDGSASAPSVAGTDSNSGVYFGADTIKFSTGGTERLSITNAGVAGAGLFVSYAILEDQKSAASDGGTATSGDGWFTRDLNTEVTDPDSITSISSNKFTLQAGSYLITWIVPAYRTGENVTRLYDVTNSATKGISLTGYVNSSDSTQIHMYGSARVSPTGATEYRIEHNVNTTKSGNGRGVSANLGVNEVYTHVEIYKEV